MSTTYYSMAERLDAILASLPDDLLVALKARTGRPGYGPLTLFRAYVTSFVLNSKSISAALRAIADDPQLTSVVGGAPTKYAVSRFINKLKDTNLLDRCIALILPALQELLPDLGETVAIDSTDISAWSSRKRTDPDAQSAMKRGTDGKNKWWYGYKFHLACCAKYEIPLAAYATPANESDFHQVEPTLARLPIPPCYVLADAGYDSAANREIVESYNAIPIIKRNKRNNRTMSQPTKEWQELYGQRTSIERMFGRLKDSRRLNCLTLKGLAKATIHCLTAILTLLAWALAALLLEEPDLIRCTV